MTKLPVIELTIDDIELDRVEAVAFVDNPAIQVGWMAFNDHKELYTFQTTDEEKRIVAGPLMIPDMNIYRNMKGKEFFVKFSAQTIELIVDKFMKEGRVKAFNFMHNEEQIIDGAYIQQSFIIDSAKGVNPPKGYENLPDGTWFGFVKVENDTIWNEYVKTGKLKGFSVEGNFSEKLNFNEDKNNFMSNLKEKIDAQIENFMKKYFNNEQPAAEPAPAGEFSTAKLADGTEIKYEGTLGEGVTVTAADGTPLADGEYTLEDGSVFAISGGVVAAMKQPEAVEQPDMTAQMSAEIEALKLENETLKTAIAGLQSKDEFKTEIERLENQSKEMFSLVEMLAKEIGKEPAAPHQFAAQEVKINTKVAWIAEQFKKNRK